MFQHVAGLDRTRKHGILNLRFQYEVEDTLDVTLVGVRRQTLQQDGARHGVHGCVCGLHVAENLSSAIQIIRNDASVQELMNVITLEDISTVNFSASSNNALELLLPRTHFVVRGGIPQRSQIRHCSTSLLLATAVKRV